jgi:hypothetical protein
LDGIEVDPFMFRSRTGLRAVAAAAVVALGAAEAAALPIVRPPTRAPGGVHQPAAGGRKHKTKTTDPLDAAIKDLQKAEKDLGSEDRSAASKLTRSAEQIVNNQLQAARQARDRAAESGTATKEQRDELKARIAALNPILKDIRTAGKEIAARKSDEAKTAIQSAITGLEALTGGKKK